MEEQIKELGIGLTNSGDIMITISFDGQTHKTLLACNWGALRTLKNMIDDFFDKYGDKIPPAFTNAFNQENHK